VKPNLSTSDSHRRTRRDHASETAEDYVEAIAELIANRTICRVADLARRFGVTHVTVTRIIARLKTEGWVETEPYRPIGLTEQGRRLAEKSRARHEIVFQFLLAVGIDAKTAAIDAEGIEHHVSPATLRKFKSFVADASSKNSSK
jgi:DtxR family manganese transport transcriptional regulator